MRVRWLLLLLLAASAAWVWGSGRAARFALAVQVLDELRRPGANSWLRRSTPPPSRCPIQLESERLRLAADLYRPGRGAGRVPLILIPGLTEAGKNDPLVKPF